MTISVKISEENYKMLNALSGRLRTKFHRPVSINEAISHLNNNKKLSDLAGAWKMSDKEVDELKKSLKKGWNKWKTKSV